MYKLPFLKNIFPILLKNKHKKVCFQTFEIIKFDQKLVYQLFL